MSSANELVRTSINNARFSIFSDEEKKHSLSVCRINSIETLDPDGKQIHGGLYDLSMGPLEPRLSCGTCNMNYIQCPGHPGHIELDVPVYYPMYFNDLIRLLRTKCVFCHKFRMPQARVRHFLIRLKLLEMGDIEEAEQLFDLVNTSVVGSINEEEKNEGKAGQEADVEAKLKMYERRWDLYQTKQRKNPSPNTDLYIKSLQRDLIDQFHKLALAVKRCDGCGGFSPPFRKDGAAKIFQKPTPLKQRKSMVGLKLKYKTALHSMNKQEEENDSDDDIVDAQDETDSADDDSSNNDDDSDESSENGAAKTKNTEADKYLPPVEVEAQIKLLWQHQPDILNFIWMRAFSDGANVGVIDLRNADGFKIFFMRVVLVTANRFRPAAKIGDSISDHPQNIHLKRILECNSKIRLIQMNSDSASTSVVNVVPEMEQDVVAAATAAGNAAAANGSNLSKLVSLWIDLQNAVNCYMDSSKDPNPLGTQGAPIGIRQILERKEGLFRRHMMGKRVNYCCRSVISPDPYLGTNEIGIPLHFAKTLHYPTPVNDWNVKYLRTLVENGPDQYPGANQIETPDGKIIKLEKLSAMERAGKAKLLLSTPGMKVYRHLIDGDALLVNRQPTLHKPGIMAHKARVYHHVKEQTLRMNYANCNTYNADFDGDEMNCHFVQSELARAEAYYICNTDNQYIVPTSGNPLRGLIQDHVASAVKMTCKDTFLTKSEFQQLVYVAVSGLPGTEIVTAMDDMEMPPPAILKPKRLWTGKQVITALLTHLCRPPLPALNLDSKARTPATAMGAEHNEHEVIIRNGQLLSGVLDKNAIGNVSLGLVHAVYELYGAELAGRLLNAIGRLMTYYLQDAGHSCGIEDLVLTAETEAERTRLLTKVTNDAKAGLNSFLTDNAVDSLTASALVSAEKKLATFYAADRKNSKVKLDGAMQQVINKSASDVIKACLPNGLQVGFLRNNFSMMVMTGAKGSQVNQSQISCFLGQQALEGQRVPIMASGKSLPSFMPFDGSARAGGFVRDRFLTGVKPQEYYFHCMAGREGLVDTAVKTSRSGYLQRCLVKHLEELKVNYDMTVRDSAGKIIQFLYGEDGLDPMSATLLGGKENQMLFLARNNQALTHKYSLHEDFFAQGLDADSARNYHDMISKAKEMVNKGDLLKVTKGSVLLARKKVRKEFGWTRENLSKTWHPVEVLKVREKEGKEGSSKKGIYAVTLDLKYLDHEVVEGEDADEAIEKKVPLALKPTGSSTDSESKQRAPAFIVKPGLPDTVMSKLKLGSTVGACSEKMQQAITSYIAGNPHGAVVSSSSGAQRSDSQVTPAALELLMWVKYMRSLACPGEAVGCVAAQSVGEPSTQMTLNTFHLAGHGGANVTLGIPRLREIIMTASKSLKTPMMTIPLMPDRSMDAAKSLGRKLSRLSLYELLDHHGGIEVGEEITKDSPLSPYKRTYRVKLHFQPRNKIEEVFAVVFETIIATVKTGFMSKLDSLIKQDQRRAGESIAGKNDPLKAFRSQGGDDIPGRGRKGGDGDEEGEGADDVDVMEVEDDSGKKKGGKAKKVTFEGEESGESDEDEEELAEEVRNNEDIGNLKLAGSGGKEVLGYDDDEEEEEEDGTAIVVDEDTDGEKAGKKDKKKRGLSSSTATPSSSLDGDFKYSEAEGWIEMTLSYPITSRRLLMAPIAEKAAQTTMIRATKDISNAYADTTSSSPCQVITEGVNFEAVWALPETLVNHNAIKTNDIYRVLMTFGVEAARAAIVSEISGVFAVYGIDVNPRHLSLIADFMTRDGGYTPMNRMGMMSCPSPFLQMSFETTCTFLTRAAQEGLVDNHNSPSASIVLGSVPKVGTGCFDLMLPLN